MAEDKSYVPPHSDDAEKSVIGSLIVDKDAVVKVSDFLRAEDFYHDAHRMVYQAILDLYDKRVPVDLVTLANILEERKDLKVIGGASYLALLANEVPTATHIFQYATIVKEKAIMRRLIRAGDTVKGLGYQENEDIEVLIEQAEKSIFEVSQTYVSDRFVHIRDVLNQTYEKISDLHDPEAKEKYRGISTGFKSLDNILSGLQPSDLVILAARPSMGKTAFALNVAQNVAKKGNAVGLISLEMSKEQLVERMFCSLLAVDSWKMRTGKLTDDDFSKIGAVMDEMNSMKIFIDDSIGNSIAELKAKARRLKMEHGLDFLVIDYLQLMTSGTSFNQSNRVQEISEISRSLKALARDLRIPILALSQLSRAVELRPTKIPQLSDLRECVTGDTKVLLSDGSGIPIKKLEGLKPEVLAINESGKIISARSDKVWKVGEKPVYTVKLASGRKITATENHKIYSGKGWIELKNLKIGSRIGITHKFLEPKRYKGKNSRHQLLLSDNGNRRVSKGVNKWLRDLNIFGQRSFEKRGPDSLPKTVFNKIKTLMQSRGISHSKMAALRGTSYGGSAYGGSANFSFAPSRNLLSDYANTLDDELKGMCNDDIFWDKIVQIKYEGIKEVYDLTVPGPGCWLANGIISHNSGAIEQDADVVLMMYREDYYEEDSDRKGVTDVFIRKHRNGPIGHIELAFKKEQMKFLDIEKNRKVEEYSSAL